MLSLTPTSRALLFWGVCIPTRIYLTTLGDHAWLRVFASLVAATWIRNEGMSVEGFFGGPAWWADERYKHGLLWMGYAISGNVGWLQTDVMYGVYNWLRHHA